jgi:thiamine biosynthesis protein ThiS
MKIVVNGNSQDFKGTETLGQLLKELDIVPERVAVMVNDRIIPKAGRNEFGLNEGDRIEVLTFIGGG